jgi:hypothetical protein
MNAPSPDAIRAKLGREQRKQATPPDVRALLERGRRDRLDLLRQAKAIRSLAQVEAMAARKLLHIQNVKQPTIRARLLGELADWIIDQSETLTQDFGIEKIRARAKMRVVPHWVPEALAPDYLNPEITEFEAAARVRRMKREMSV